MLAFMVDLGWPWWITTLIAAGVALVGVLVFLRARRKSLRAPAALIVVEALAIAIVAPFVMESDGKSGESAMRAGALTRTEFARRADANCRELGTFAARLGNPKTPGEIERFMDRFLPEFWQAILAQRELTPPPEEQAAARRWMNAMAAYGGDQEALRAAASRRDPKAMNRANASAGAHASESARLSKELGLRVCFR